MAATVIQKIFIEKEQQGTLMRCMSDHTTQVPVTVEQ